MMFNLTRTRISQATLAAALIGALSFGTASAEARANFGADTNQAVQTSQVSYASNDDSAVVARTDTDGPESEAPWYA